MRGLLMHVFSGLVFVITSLVSAQAAYAQPQTAEQERCLRLLNSGFERMVKSQSKEIRRCLRNATKGQLAGSLDDCLRADERGYITRQRAKNAKHLCITGTQRPDFGTIDIATSNAVGVQSQDLLLHSVFGTDLENTIATEAKDRTRAQCQQGVYKAVDRCQRNKLKSFQRCIATGLSDGSIVDAGGLAACADAVKTAAAPSSEPSIARVCGGSGMIGRIERRVERRCSGRNVDLVAAFPGCAPGDAATVAGCLDRHVECQVCLALNQVDFLDRDCDAFDDGTTNGSCIGRDRWGGWTGVDRAATGRFRVDEVDGTWWFITPDGHGFFSAGVNNVNPNGDFSPPIGTSPYEDNILALYGSKEAWREVTYDRLQRWNFNTIGAFGPTSIHVGRRPYTPVRSFHSAAPEVPGWPAGRTGKRIRDFFDPSWPTGAAARARELQYCADDSFCIGAFTDNELPWGPGVFMVGTFVDAYMSLPAGAPGKLALQQLFEDRYGADISAFNAAWGLTLASFDDLQDLDTLGSDLVCETLERTNDRRAFLVRVAERYFSVVHDVIRALDPDLLILGSRLTSTAIGPDIVTAAAPYLDVMSMNHYLLDEGAINIFAGNGGVLYEYYFLDNRFVDLEAIHTLSGRPVMITEYSIRTPTPNVSVLYPPFMPTFDTQEERTDAYEEYQRQVLSRPYMIGAHWFEYWDQPETGRGDGENSLFGVVTIEDTPRPELTERMTLLNALVPERPIPPPIPDIFPPSVPRSSGAASSLDATGPSLVLRAATAGTLGSRIFSIAPPGSDRTGFYVGILPGQNVGGNFSGGPLILEGGDVDGSGNAPLTLQSDVVIGVLAIVGDVLCLRLDAEGSSGTVSCDGGVGHDVTVTSDTGESAPPAVTESFLGADSGPGAATLLAPTEFARLPAGADVADCLTTDQYEPQQLMAFSTGIVTITKGTEQLILQGENFECGADGTSWQIEDGTGMLAVGLPVFDGRVPGGDLASGLLLADRADLCP